MMSPKILFTSADIPHRWYVYQKREVLYQKFENFDFT
jgi:hypothetical protein